MELPHWADTYSNQVYPHQDGLNKIVSPPQPPADH